jgi:hypothetical protein
LLINPQVLSAASDSLPSHRQLGGFATKKRKIAAIATKKAHEFKIPCIYRSSFSPDRRPTGGAFLRSQKPSVFSKNQNEKSTTRRSSVFARQPALLLAIGYWLLAVGCWLLAIGCGHELPPSRLS